MSMRIKPLRDPSDQLIEAMVQLFAETFSQPPYNEEHDPQGTRDFFLQSMEKPGFAGCIAYHPGDTPEEGLTGFAFGYGYDPDMIFGQRFKETLGERASFWLNDCFEFVEMAVHPSSQGQGTGRRLHNYLFNDLDYKTALLILTPEAEAARKLYQSAGWEVLDDSFQVRPDPEQPVRWLMGLRLNNSVTK